MRLSKQERQRLETMRVWENWARQQGYQRLAGVDEAGRGPLAGPVVAAACILPDTARIKGINDSKQLLAEEREQIFQQLLSLPDIDYGIGISDALVIDQVNILQATFQAMNAAIARLRLPPDFVFVDGDKLPLLTIPGRAIVDGDSLSLSIAAGSIIAKVTRDQLMRAYHDLWPQYGFDSHKGYATSEHIDAILKYGPCPIHRMSFDPLKTLFKKEL